LCVLIGTLNNEEEYIHAYKKKGVQSILRERGPAHPRGDEVTTDGKG